MERACPRYVKNSPKDEHRDCHVCNGTCIVHLEPIPGSDPPGFNMVAAAAGRYAPLDGHPEEVTAPALPPVPEELLEKPKAKKKRAKKSVSMSASTGGKGDMKLGNKDDPS